MCGGVFKFVSNSGLTPTSDKIANQKAYNGKILKKGWELAEELTQRINLNLWHPKVLL